MITSRPFNEFTSGANQVMDRGQDIIMMALHNSQERTLEEYQQLVTGADARLRFVGCSQPEGSVLSFIEFQLEGHGDQRDDS